MDAVGLTLFGCSLVGTLVKIHSTPKTVLHTFRVSFDHAPVQHHENLKDTHDIIKTLLGTKKEKQNKQNLFENEKVLGEEIIAARNAQMSVAVPVFHKETGGLVVLSGKGVHLMDSNGTKYLDVCNNVASVGHSHPRVVKAGQDALEKIQTNSRFLHPTHQRYIAKLLKKLPKELDTIFMVTTGSEANDLALRIAQETALKNNCPYSKEVLCIDSAYHGHTQSLIDISPYKWYQAVDGKNRQPLTTHVAPLPDGYRGKFQHGQTEECGKAYAAEIEQLIDEHPVGAFIHESIIGCGGQVVPPPKYLQRCYAAVRAGGGVCIADEVQTGFGRVGETYWAFEQHGVVPDIVTMGKPIGNGYPLAAVALRREIANNFAATGIEYFNTYGGNSVACSIGEAVLDTIEDEKLQENSAIVGDYCKTRLQSLQDNWKWIGDVRGSGLFLGVEIVRSPSPSSTKVPHPALCKFLLDYMFVENVMVSRDGRYENVVKVKPPMVFSMQNVDCFIDAFEKALEAAKVVGCF